jgi:hypothetical protein
MVSEPVKPVLNTVTLSPAVGAYWSQSDKGEVVIGGALDHFPSYRQRGSFAITQQVIAATLEMFPSFSRLRLLRQWGGTVDVVHILALTVNRWPHGYSYTYDTLADPDVPEVKRPHVLGRQPFGRISIANADAGAAAAAFTNAAIDQAERAVQECLASRGMI